MTSLLSRRAAMPLAPEVKFINREVRDKTWALVFLAFVACQFAVGGFYAYKAQDKSFVDAFGMPEGCVSAAPTPAPTSFFSAGSRARRMLATESPAPHNYTRGTLDGVAPVLGLMAQHAEVAVGSVVVTFLVAFGWVSLLQTFSVSIVFATYFLSVATWFFSGYMMLQGDGTQLCAYVFFLLGLLMLLYGVSSRGRTRLRRTGQTMSLASELIKADKRLLLVAAFLKIVYLAYLCFVTFLSYKTVIGASSWVKVTDDETGEVACDLVVPYLPLAIINLVWLWTHMMFKAVLAFTVAGTTSTLYFHRPQVEAHFNDARGDVPKNPSTFFAGLALRKSFGSNAVAALILSIAEMAKRSARRRNGSGGGAQLAMLLMRLCCSFFASLLEVYSRFSVIICAITGASFFAAAGRGHGLLKRNFAGAYINDRVGRMVLQLGSFLLSLGVGFATYATYSAEIGSTVPQLQWYGWVLALAVLAVPMVGLLVVVLYPQIFYYLCSSAVALGTSADDVCGPFSTAFSAALFSAVVAHFVLLLVSKLVLDAMDTVFICFAIDRDNQIVTVPKLHVVAALYPEVKKNTNKNNATAATLEAGQANAAVPPAQYAPYEYANVPYANVAGTVGGQ